jgi:hypothetical protein
LAGQARRDGPQQQRVQQHNQANASQVLARGALTRCVRRRRVRQTRVL